MVCPDCKVEMIGGGNAWRGVQIRNNLDINPTLALVGTDCFTRRMHGEDKQKVIYPVPHVCPSCGLLRLYLHKENVTVYEDMINKSKEYDTFADKYEDLTGEKFKITEKWYKTIGRYIRSKLPKRKRK